MSFKRPCLDCPRYSVPGQPRCESCAKKRENARSPIRRAQRGRTPNQQRLRREVNRAGSAQCYICENVFYATEISIDHVIPLFKNREADSIPGNVKPACRECHAEKSRQEALERAAVERKHRGWTS
jgi:5-methylcytosine-specific restriction endonuclease McrA